MGKKNQSVKWLSRRIAAPGPFLTLCLSDEQYQKVMRHCKIKAPGDWISSPYADATTHLLNNQNGEPLCVVCINASDKHDSIEIAGLLVHEAVHVWQKYCDQIGERMPGIEQEAYGIQAIAQELLQSYSEQI